MGALISFVRLDGGLATTLQAQGLPRYTPVESWLIRHPETIRAAHQRFVDAGAQIVLTGTLCCLPSLRSDWARLAPTAVALASSTGVDVWLSLGPGAGHLEVINTVQIQGVVLETFTDPHALLQVVRSIRTGWNGPLVACLVPLKPLSPKLPLLLAEAGATGIGMNCASVASMETQVQLWDDHLPLWLKPHPGPFRRLAKRAHWLGGCCGTTPTLLQDQFSSAGPYTAN